MTNRINLNQDWVKSLWARRWKNKPKPAANPTSAKLNRLTQQAMAEIMDDHPGKAIQAIQELASFMKTIGMGKDSFNAIMENLESGREPGEVRRWLRNKEFYLGRSVIYKL